MSKLVLDFKLSLEWDLKTVAVSFFFVAEPQRYSQVRIKAQAN